MKAMKRLGLLMALMLMTVLLAGCLNILPFFGEKQYDIAGKVATAAGDGIEDVSIVLSSGSTVTTDADGAWEAKGVKGTVTVSAVKDDYLIIPSKRTVQAKSDAVDFVGYPLVYVDDFDENSDPAWTAGDWEIVDGILQAPASNGAWTFSDFGEVEIGEVPKVLVELLYRPSTETDASFSLILYDDKGNEVNLTVSRIHATGGRSHKYALSIKADDVWQTVAEEPGTTDDHPSTWQRIRLEVHASGQILAFHDDIQVVDGDIGSTIETKFVRVGMTSPFDHNPYQFDRIAIAVEESTGEEE